MKISPRDIARYYAWVFGPIFMVTLGAIAIMPLLTGCSQWILIIGLFLYYPAALIRFWDDILQLRKK